eukprot:TRINITY_DN4453_c0_g1_i4.p1 TRINITY_DN4453_c0_g1~~TRINITY_DN4453_c0_g1_i4.p1  ORF type:complete len:392 (+),score=63.18 TRINITY_DN4453_c0_g1_i4:82-1257(+)
MLGPVQGPPPKQATACRALEDRDAPQAKRARVGASWRPQQPLPAPLSVVPAVANKAVTDTEGHYVVQQGAVLGVHYRIVCQLGEGTFSKVVECEDLRSGTRVAIKVVRAVKKYQDNALLEMSILQQLQECDTHDRVCFVKPLSYFTDNNHICIIFKKFGLSLYDFLKKNKFRGFDIPTLRHIAHQTLCCVAFCHSRKLIHTDLKPENILFEEGFHVDAGRGAIPDSTQIRIIDFGSSIFEHQHHAALIQTRHYRSPEVILGLGWSFPTDMWSVGCILVELLTGDALFQTHDSQEHLCMMKKVFGHFPLWLGTKCRAGTDKPTQQWFSKDGALLPLTPTSSGARYLAKMRTLHEILASHPDLEDLTNKMLVYDPEQRITAAEAIKHRFFTSV